MSSSNSTNATRLFTPEYARHMARVLAWQLSEGKPELTVDEVVDRLLGCENTVVMAECAKGFIKDDYMSREEAEQEIRSLFVDGQISNPFQHEQFLKLCIHPDLQ